MMIKKIGLLLLCGQMSSCVYSVEDQVELQTSIEEDTLYREALQKATRHARVIKDFEMRYNVSVTYLDPEFRAAFQTRYNKIFQQAEPFLGEALERTGFFVTVYTPEERVELDNEFLWNITLEVGGQKRKPAVVRRVSEKRRWEPFFSAINPWTEEYLLLFDRSHASLDSGAMLQSNDVKLLMANADAHVQFAW